MKRRYNRENSSESDCSSLSSYSKLDNNWEYELSNKPKCEVTNKNTITEEEQMFQCKKILEPCTVTVVLSTENDDENIPKSHCEKGKIIIKFFSCSNTQMQRNVLK